MGHKGKKGEKQLNWDEIYEIKDPRVEKLYYIDASTGKRIKLKEKRAMKHGIKKGYLAQNPEFSDAIDLIGPDNEIVKKNVFNIKVGIKEKDYDTSNRIEGNNGGSSSESSTEVKKRYNKNDYTTSIQSTQATYHENRSSITTKNRSSVSYNEESDEDSYSYSKYPSSYRNSSKIEKVAETPSGVLPTMEISKASSNIIFTDKNTKKSKLLTDTTNETSKTQKIGDSENSTTHNDNSSNIHRHKEDNENLVGTSTNITYSYNSSYPGEESSNNEESSQHLRDKSNSDLSSRGYTTYSPTPKSMIGTRVMPDRGSTIDLPSPIINTLNNPTINVIQPNVDGLTTLSTDRQEDIRGNGTKEQKHLELSMLNDTSGCQNSVVPKLPIDDYSPIGNYHNPHGSSSESSDSIYKENSHVSINGITCTANQIPRNRSRRQHENKNYDKRGRNSYGGYTNEERGSGYVSGNNGRNSYYDSGNRSTKIDGYNGGDDNTRYNGKNSLMNTSSLYSGPGGSGQLLTVEYSKAKTILEELRKELKCVEENNLDLRDQLYSLQHEEELLKGLIHVLRNSTYRWDGSEENVYWDQN